jgi:hypothetical protein
VRSKYVSAILDIIGTINAMNQIKPFYMLMNKRHFALYLAFFLIIILAFFLRLYHLDERVFHHDEAAVAYGTYKLFNDGIYTYDPYFHGPFMYYVTSEMYRHFGDNIFASRLFPAILGASMIFLLIPLRRYLGNSSMLFAAFFLAFSPSFLYYSRFYREDTFISFFTLLALVCAVKYAEAFDKDRRNVSLLNLHFFAGYSIERIFYLALGGIAISSMAALKENAYITIALIALFLFLVFIRERYLKSLIDRMKRPDKEFIILIAEGVFLILVVLVVFSLFYTGNILDVAGMKTTVEKAISACYEMHRIQRLGGPYFFYPGSCGHNVSHSRQLCICGKILTNILPPILDYHISSASSHGDRWCPLYSESFFVHSSIQLNFINYANTDEPMIQAGQPPQKFSEFITKIYEISSQYSNQSTRMQVTDENLEVMLLWYSGHYPNVEWKVSMDAKFNAPLIVVHDSDGNETLFYKPVMK